MDFPRRLEPARRARALGLLLVLLAVGVVLVMRTMRGGGEPAEPFPWLPEGFSLIATLEDGSDGDELLREGLAAYANREPAAAIESLGRANASGTFESVRRVYLGSALAHTDRHQEAAAILEQTPFASLPEPWRSDGTWTLAVLWREAGRADAADSLLNTLAEGAGPAADRARNALRRGRN